MPNANTAGVSSPCSRVSMTAHIEEVAHVIICHDINCIPEYHPNHACALVHTKTEVCNMGQGVQNTLTKV